MNDFLLAKNFISRLKDVFKESISIDFIKNDRIPLPIVEGTLLGAYFRVAFLHGYVILNGDEPHCIDVLISIINDYLHLNALLKYDGWDVIKSDITHCAFWSHDPETKIVTDIVESLKEKQFANIRTIIPNKQWFIDKEIKRVYGQSESKANNNGSLTEEEIDCMDEIETLDKIDEITVKASLYSMQLDKGIIPEYDIDNYVSDMNLLIASTRRFGVNIDPNIHTASGRIMESEDYKAWYKYYSDHFKIRMSDDERIRYKLARENHEDISEFMPPLSYREYKQQKEKQI